MMYRTRVASTRGKICTDTAGAQLICIGNINANAGDYVWTDGRCVYGNQQESSAPPPIVFSDSGVILVSNMHDVPTGYITQGGAVKSTNVPWNGKKIMSMFVNDYENAYICASDEKFYNVSTQEYVMDCPDDILDVEISDDGKLLVLCSSCLYENGVEIKSWPSWNELQQHAKSAVMAQASSHGRASFSSKSGLDYPSGHVYKDGHFYVKRICTMYAQSYCTIDTERGETIKFVLDETYSETIIIDSGKIVYDDEFRRAMFNSFDTVKNIVTSEAAYAIPFAESMIISYNGYYFARYSSERSDDPTAWYNYPITSDDVIRETYDPYLWNMYHPNNCFLLKHSGSVYDFGDIGNGFRWEVSSGKCTLYYHDEIIYTSENRIFDVGSACCINSGYVVLSDIMEPYILIDGKITRLYEYAGNKRVAVAHDVKKMAKNIEKLRGVIK